jgi:hypothetical protein
MSHVASYCPKGKTLKAAKERCVAERRMKTKVRADPSLKPKV